MNYGTYNSQYIENDVMSRSPEWLIPLLYEHLLASLSRAAVEIEFGEKAAATSSLEKASRIVFELLTTLDLGRGGEVAQHLSSLYSFFASEIVQLGHNPDGEKLQNIIPMISDLHDSWVAAAEAVAPRTRTTQAA